MIPPINEIDTERFIAEITLLPDDYTVTISQPAMDRLMELTVFRGMFFQQTSLPPISCLTIGKRQVTIHPPTGIHEEDIIAWNSNKTPSQKWNWIYFLRSQRPQRGVQDQAMRFNEGKLEWSLVDFESLEPMVRMLEYGAKRYARDNWKKGLPVTKCCESLLRHLFSLMKGEDIDKESGLPHVGSIQCNAMFLAHTLKHHRYLDDRPGPKDTYGVYPLTPEECRLNPNQHEQSK